MKFLLRNIQGFIKKQPVIFSVMIICIAFSSLILFFSYGLFHEYELRKREAGDMDRSFDCTVTAREGKYPTIEEIEKWALSLEEDTTDALGFAVALRSPLVHEEKMNGGKWGEEYFEDNTYFFYFSIRDKKLVDCYQIHLGWGRYLNGFMDKGRWISDKELEDGEMVAVGSRKHQDGKKETLSVDGKTYKIVGVQNITETPVVPVTTVDTSYPVVTMNILFENPVTLAQYENMRSTLSYMFGSSVTISDLSPQGKLQNDYNNSILLISVVIAVLAVFIITILYEYVLLQRKKQLTVMRMYGLTRFGAVKLYVAECLCISVPTFVLMGILYSKCLVPVLKRQYTYIESAYSGSVYVTIFLVFFLTMIVALSGMIFTKISPSIVKEWKEE